MATIASIPIDNASPLVVFAGPCAIEGGNVFAIAETLKGVSERLGFPLVFKASFDKANRQSSRSERGCGIEEGLEILAEVKRRFALPVLTDIHLPEQAAVVAETVDCIQIPAFLCRQTDLVNAAAATGKTMNIKKGQFLAPDQMRSVVEKARSAGARDVLVTERGVTFGYHDLVFDPRSPAIMKEFAPVIFDVTHCVQRPGAGGETSGGDRRFVPDLLASAVAIGIAGVFIETHPDPASALSDRETQWPLADFEKLMKRVLMLDKAIKC